MENKLNFQQTLVDGFNLGVKNIGNLLLIALLYVITAWIPYLNVGTTIGLFKAIVGLSKGEEVDPMSLFKKENYKSLGDFFLLLGLETAGIGAAAMFFFIPALVVGLAWQYAVYFFLDKGTSPLKSLGLSYDVTCGEKWMLFFIYLAVGVVICLVAGLLACIPAVGGALSLIAVICAIPVVIGIEAVLYKHFCDKADAAA